MRPIFLIGLVGLVVALAAASLLAGLVWFIPGQAWRSLWAPEPTLTTLVLVDIRAPRTVLALLIGAILGLSGAVLQGLLRNPLAESGLLGAGEDERRSQAHMVPVAVSQRAHQPGSDLVGGVGAGRQVQRQVDPGGGEGGDRRAGQDQPERPAAS